jgi:hypothetical protein
MQWHVVDAVYKHACTYACIRLYGYPVRSSADVFRLVVVVRYKHNNNSSQCLHQRPTADFHSSTTWPSTFHLRLVHTRVRPLLRTRTSCPLHRPAAACSSVPSIRFAASVRKTKGPANEIFLNIQRQRTGVGAFNTHRNICCARFFSPKPKPFPHHITCCCSSLPTYRSRTVLRSDNKVQPYPKATTRFHLLPTTLRTLPARPLERLLAFTLSGLTRLTTLRNLATLLASPVQVNLRHHKSTSISGTFHDNHRQPNPRTLTGSLVRKKTLVACNIASLALSLPMRFL